MATSLALEPLIDPLLLAVLALILIASVVPGLIRRSRAAWLRAAAAVVVIAALANPVVVNEDREPLTTIAALVVDRSASQTLDGRDVATSLAADGLAERFAGFQDIDLRIIEVDSAGGSTDGTRLFEALNAALIDVPPERLGAIVMLTDGQVHDAPTDRAGLPEGVPVHALITGREAERDRRIEIVSSPRFGIVNETQSIRFRVIDEGTGDANVTISLDGEPRAFSVVRTGELAELQVEIDHGGQNIFEIATDAVEGELTTVNNRAVVPIEGVRENLRVLLVSGEPHAGERTWRNLLKSDAAVDLVHFTILRPPSKQDGTPINQLSLIAFPTRELFSEKIDEFDLIIFDRYQHRGVLPLLYFDNISEYVRGGGALLVAAGPDFAGFSSLFHTPLAPVLPVAPTGEVIEEPYLPRMTETGLRHPVTRALPGSDTEPPSWGRFFRLVEVGLAEGDTLMNGLRDQPLLVLDRRGDGRIATLLSDHTWLWARGFEGGGPHVDLLRRLAHWLMKEPDLEEEVLRARTVGSDLVVERQSMESGSGDIAIESPSGSGSTLTPGEVEPGLWRATAPAAEIGLYRITQGDFRAFAHNGPANPREFSDVRSTADVLRPLVAATGGRIARLGEPGALDLPRIVPLRGGTVESGRDWIGVRVSEASLLKGISRTPVMSEFGSLAGIVGLLGLILLIGLPFITWLREGR